MDLSTEFAEVESIPFAVSLFHASKLSMLLNLAQKNSSVQKIDEALKTKEGPKLLQERIAYLSGQTSDPNFVDVFDIALAVYLHLLYSQDPSEGKRAAALVGKLEECYWADMLSHAILVREDSGAQAAQG